VRDIIRNPLATRACTLCVREAGVALKCVGSALRLCVYVLQSAGNEHRLFAIHRLSQKKTLMHAHSCTSIQHSSRLFVLKAKQNALCKDTTGTDRSCSNHLTQLLYRDSTADMPTSDFFQTRPQARSVTLPRRSLLPLYGMRLNVISFTSVRTVRPSPRRFSRHSHCVYMSYTECHRTRTTSVDIHVQYTHHCHRTRTTSVDIHLPYTRHFHCTRTSVDIHVQYTHHCHRTRTTSVDIHVP